MSKLCKKSKLIFIFAYMYIVERATGKKHEIIIEPVMKEDYKQMTKKRYFFNWKTEKPYHVYKLRRTNGDDLLGLVSFEIDSIEPWILIRLLTVSKENKGSKTKEYERITGNLIAYVCREAQKLFGKDACIALEPKTGLVEHYISKYGMEPAIDLLYLLEEPLLALIKKYEV